KTLSITGVLCAALTLFNVYTSPGQTQSGRVNWVLGSSTSLIPDLSPETLRAVKASGIEMIELGWRSYGWHDLSYEGRLRRAREVYQATRDAGITVWSTHIPYGEDVDISNPDDEHRRKAIVRVKEFIDLGLELGVRQVVLHPSERIAEDTRQERVRKCRASLRELSRYLEGKGVTLALESLPPDFMGNSSAELITLVDGIPHIGICFDTNHLVPEKGEDFVRAAGSRITTLHVADFDGVTQKHWMPGRGVVDWRKVIEALVKAGYSGPFMYEVVRREGETHTFRDLKGNYEMLMKRWN